MNFVFQTYWESLIIERRNQMVMHVSCYRNQLIKQDISPNQHATFKIIITGNAIIGSIMSEPAFIYIHK